MVEIEGRFNEIRQKLIDRRVKIRPMCRAIGVSYQTIYNIIHDKNKSYNIMILIKIAKYLDENHG